MSYEYLNTSAKKIPPAGDKAISEYHIKSELLVAAINMHMTSLENLQELIGKNNVAMMKNNHTNHMLFIHSILKYPNSEVLVDTILWVFKTYRSHGFSTDYWVVQIKAWQDILKDQLTEATFIQILPLYKWIQENIPLFDKLSAINKEEENSLQ